MDADDGSPHMVVPKDVAEIVLVLAQKHDLELSDACADIAMCVVNFLRGAWPKPHERSVDQFLAIGMSLGLYAAGQKRLTAEKIKAMAIDIVHKDGG